LDNSTQKSLELHQALTEKMISYQKKQDALKEFEHEMLNYGRVFDAQTVRLWERLRADQDEAYKLVDAARRVYIAYMRLQNTP